MIPFSQNTKWIENASRAYYYAYGWVEQALLGVKNRSSLTQELSDPMWTTSTWISYQTTSSWIVIPPYWMWNSDFNNQFDYISIWSPIQLEVWNKWTWLSSYNWEDFEIWFKVPNFTWWKIELSWGTMPIVNWMLSSDTDTLYAESWSYFVADDINF